MIDYFADPFARQQQAFSQPDQYQIPEEERQGLLSSLYQKSLGGLAYLGSSLDKGFGGRAVRGLLGGRPEELLSLIPFSDTLGITNEMNAVQGTDLLEQFGLADQGDGLGKTIAGVGLEMLLDPSSYIGIGALTRAGQAAKASGNLTKGFLPGIRSGERALLEVGLPFMKDTSQYLGTGAQVADNLATAGGFAKGLVSKPFGFVENLIDRPAKAVLGVNPLTAALDGAKYVGRQGRAMFDPAVREATSAAGQGLAIDQYAPAEDAVREAMRPLYGQVGDLQSLVGQRYGVDAQQKLVNTLNQAIEIPPDASPFVQRIQQTAKETIDTADARLLAGEIDVATHADLVQAAKNTEADLVNRATVQQDPWRAKTAQAWNDLSSVIGPDLVAEGQQRATDIAQALEKQRVAAKKLGSNVGDLADNEIINYFPRQATPLEHGDVTGFLGDGKTARTAGGDPSTVRRMDALRYLPGGTQQIEELVTNPALRKLSKDALSDYLGVQITGQKIAKDHPAMSQAKELADFILNADEAYTKPGARFWDNDTAKIFKDYSDSQAARMGTLGTVVEGMKLYATPPGSLPKGKGTKVSEVLDAIKATMTPDVATELTKKLTSSKQNISDFELPTDLANDMVRMGTTWKTPEALRPVVDLWDKSLNFFKTGVTAVFPSFHTRNLMSGEYNKFRAGASSPASSGAMLDVLRGGYLPNEIAAKLYPGQSAEEATRSLRQELLARDVAFGRRSRTTSDVVGQTGNLMPYELPDITGTKKGVGDVAKDFARGFLPDPKLTAQGYSPASQYLNPFLQEGVGADKNVNRFVAQGRELGNQIEDYLRGSHYLEKRLQGYVPKAAAEDVAKYQLDYGNMTQFEKQVAKRAVPWYAFSRRNLPSILEDLVEKPGRTAQTIRAVAGTRNPDEFAPQYIAEGASLPLGMSGPDTARFISSFGLPVEDELLKTIGSAMSGDFRRTSQQLLGMGVPWLKAPYEQAFDTQLFSGRRLSDLDPGKIASLGGTLPDPVAQAVSQLLGNTPAARVVSTAERFLDDRKGLGATSLNALTGVRISDVDLNRSRLAAQRDQLQELLRPSQQVRIREEAYVPKDQLQNLDPVERLMYELYQGVRRDQSKAARDRTN